MSSSHLAMLLGAIMGGALMGALLLWRMAEIKRFVILMSMDEPENKAWIENNCTEREKQAVFNLVYAPPLLNDYDRAILVKLATRAPKNIAQAITAQQLLKGEPAHE